MIIIEVKIVVGNEMLKKYLGGVDVGDCNFFCSKWISLFCCIIYKVMEELELLCEEYFFWGSFFLVLL